MLIQTTRFGPIEVDETKIITLKEGLLGFPQYRRYALIQAGGDPDGPAGPESEPVFFWLQSVDAPNLAFVVCDPLVFVPDYQVPIRRDDMEGLQLQNLEDAQVLVIVNKVDSALTANLLGPIVVGARSLQGKQLVLSDKRYGTRHRLMPLEQDASVVKTA